MSLNRSYINYFYNTTTRENKPFFVITLEKSYLVVLNQQNINKMFSFIRIKFPLPFNSVIFFQQPSRYKKCQVTSRHKIFEKSQKQGDSHCSVNLIILTLQFIQKHPPREMLSQKFHKIHRTGKNLEWS